MLRQALRIRFVASLLMLALLAAACSSDSEPDAAPAPTPAATSAEPTPTEPEIEAPEPIASAEPVTPAGFTVRPSVNQLHVLGAEPGTALALVGPDGSISPGTVDAQGAFLWRDIAAGEYVVQTTDPLTVSEPALVTDPDELPDQRFYADQSIEAGFGYLTTRDGTTLSINVSLPSGPGPFPTVVEYSGYDPSNPANSTFPLLFTTLGYAYVGVNMRGTGCSGGSFEFFEPVQLTDGYDVIEAIAAQPWVLHNQVGMVGVSYPGISQLFVASTQPPSLAAITPLSVLDDSTRSTLYPGGILNTGFAGAWSDEREADAQPYGQGWEQGQVDAGDTVCAANQLLRLQNTDAARLIEENPFYVAELSDPIAPARLVDDIVVPVFLAGAWQDEQTGGHFPAMLDDFTNTPHLYATMMNGSHTESIANLAVFERYVEFLELYVARRTPDLSNASFVAGILTGSLTGVDGLALPTGDRFTGLSYEEALAAYEQQPPIRILFEDGAAEGQPPGAPLPRYEATFDTWPIPEGELVTWFLDADGRLRPDPVTSAPGAAPPSSYVADPASVPATFYEGGSSGIWAADVTYDWMPIPDGTGVAWITDPLAADTVVAGFGSLDLWLRSTAPDTDLEVTISEVRADGTEVYVQSGWLRASRRALDEDASRPNQPQHTHLEADAAPLPPGEFSEVRVEIFPFAHAFRAGSQIRVTVDAPGGARPTWAFANTLAGGETNEIAHDAEHPSKLVLRTIPGVDVPPGPPACGALRSQPCREYVPFGAG